MRKFKVLALMVMVCGSVWGQGYVKDENNAITPIYIKDGKVGVGTKNPESNMEIHGSNNFSLTLKDTNLGNRFQIGMANGSGAYATYAKQSDVVIRTIGTNFLHINHSWGSSDGSGGITFGDNTNGRTLNVFNNGKITVGTTDPTLPAKLAVDGEFWVQNGWLRVKGQKGLYFQDYGGGFYMKDNSWIRTWGDKNFYHNTGIMRTDGTFQVGSGGSRFHVNASGNVGIGITNPSAYLHILGDGRTIGGTNLSKSYALFGTTSLGIGIDANEITNKGGDLYIQSITGSLGLNVNNEKEYRFNVGGNNRLFINKQYSKFNGNVGIGKIPEGTNMLDVAGTIRAEEILVEANGNTADFVFEEDYDLKDLSEVESFILTNKHLPEIPSAAQMEEQGVNLAEMNKLLLQKVEELTLYAIQQEEARRKEKGEREKLENELKVQSEKLKELDTLKDEMKVIKELITNDNLK